MSVRFDDTGMKKLQQKLQELERELNTSIPVLELLSPQFMGRHSNYASFGALLETIGITSAETFDALSADDRDRLIREGTNFSGWDEMLKAAGNAWIQQKINQAGLGPG